MDLPIEKYSSEGSQSWSGRPGKSKRAGYRLPRPRVVALSSWLFRSLPSHFVHVVVDHRVEVLGVALHGEDDGALLDAVGAGCHRGDDLPAVRQVERHAEGAVRVQLDRVIVQGQVRGRVGAAEDDQLRVDLEEELLHAARGHRAGAEGGLLRRAELAAGALLKELPEFGAAGRFEPGGHGEDALGA